jgi:hypothetical protein
MHFFRLSSFARRPIAAVVFAVALSAPVPAQILPASANSKAEKADNEPKQKNPSKKKGKKGDEGAERGGPAAPAAGIVDSIPFGELNGREPLNASGAVALADGRFLFCDNKTSDALFELRLDAGGRKVGSLVRRSISAAGGVADMEGMALVEVDGQKFAVATSSFGLRPSRGKKSDAGGGASEGLLRVDIAADGGLAARKMTGVREWLVAHYPELKATASLDPDRGGLNLEGLAWDPSRGALLFGVRTPLVGGKPLILPVRLNVSAPWTLEALEALPAIRLALDPSAGQGVRAIDYDPTGKNFWISVGRAVSGGPAPFAMYLWDGNQEGNVRRLPGLVFDEAMKVEGVVAGTVGGKNAILLLDDGGGYKVVWADDPRLQ